MKANSLRKKSVAFLLSAMMITGQIPYLGEVVEVSAATHWAQTYLNNLSQKGIMRGDQAGNMEPDRKITRAEFVSMLNRAFGYKPQPGQKNAFSDVKGTEWYAQDLNTAAARGYFSGRAKGKAEPNGNLTREEAVAMITRNLKIPGDETENLNFQDSRNFSSWSRSAINAATKKGIINGYQDGTFRSRNTITRGETAKMLSDTVGELVNVPTIKNVGLVDGNMTISSPDVMIRDGVITGDLYITGGVGTGSVELSNVRVMGEVIISGGGESDAGQSSIAFRNSTANTLTVDGPTGKIVSVKAYGSTQISKVNIKSSTYLEEIITGDGGFINITQEGTSGSTLTLSGNFDNVTVKGQKNNFRLAKGTLRNLIVSEDAVGSLVQLDKTTFVGKLSIDVATKVTGSGEIGDLTVGVAGVTVESLPDKIIIRPGITASINGQVMGNLEGEMSSAIPKITSGYPSVEDITAAGGTSYIKANKPGTVYWAVVQADLDKDLTAAELVKPTGIKEVTKSGSFASKNGNEELKNVISGLKPNTEYILSTTLLDSRGTLGNVKTVDFITSDNTVPNFVSGYPAILPQIGVVTKDVKLSVNTTKDATVYWALLPKSSVAPSDLELKKGVVAGNVGVGNIKTKKNVESTFTISGSRLEEAKAYDLYLIASDGTNDSKIVKMAAATKDITPPVFLDGYPKMDKITDKTIDIKVKTNEDATVFYVVMKKDAPFPPAVLDPNDPTKPPTQPGMDTDAAKEAVVTGNNTYKSGKISAKVDTEAFIKLSGLEPEKRYDVYMVAQDKSGNNSAVSKIIVNTTDVIAPSVKQFFTDDLDGSPRVESDLVLTFSEEVWSANTLKPLTISDIIGDDTATPPVVGSIILYDVTDHKMEKVPILNTDLITIATIDEGATQVTFKKGALDINSGVSYQFVFTRLMDTVGNRMKDGYALPVFTTVAPFVKMEKPPIENMDMLIRLTPEGVKTPDYILYDMIIESNATVEFELYERPITDPPSTFENVNTLYATAGSPSTYNPLIMENQALTLHYIIDRKIKGLSGYEFEKFNGFTQGKEYGIKILAIDGNFERESWDKTVTLKFKSVSGPKTVMDALAGNPIGGFNNAIQAGAMEVSYPKLFSASASFTDTAIPDFVKDSGTGNYLYPDLGSKGNQGPDSSSYYEYDKVGDILLEPTIMTTKKATFYYVVAPKGSYGTPPTPVQIMSMTTATKPVGGVYGKAAISTGNMAVPVTIQGLQSETDYDMYYFLKGTPPETSPLQKKEFRTKKITPPILTPTVDSRGGDNATVTVRSTTNSTIDWIMIPQNQYEAYLKAMVAPDPDNRTEDQKAADAAAVAEIIRNGKENLNLKPVGFGTMVTDKSTPPKSTVTVKGLERNIYYVFLAVGKANLGTGTVPVGYDSKIVFLESITPTDTTPPGALSSTVITNAIDPGTGLPYPAGTAYNGYLSLKFTEPIYYIPSEGAKPLPLPKTVAEFNALNILSTAAALPGTITVMSVSEDEIVMQFTGVLKGSNISFNKEICDASGNKAGWLYMIFTPEATGVGRDTAQWTVSFKTQNSLTASVRSIAEPIEPTPAMLSVMSKNAPVGGTKPVAPSTPTTKPSTPTTTPTAPPTTPTKPSTPTTTPSTPTVTKPLVSTKVTLSTTAKSYAGKPYNGYVTFNFEEAPYYLEGGVAKPLTFTVLKSSIKGKATAVSSYSKAFTTGGSKVFSGAQLSFTGATDGTEIYFDKELCDAKGNKLGKLYLTFQDRENSGGRAASTWEASFK